MNPIADPTLTDAMLTFTNVAVDADVARAPQQYRATWSSFDNATWVTKPITDTTSVSTSMDVPAGLPTRDGAFIRVDLSAMDAAHPTWSSPVHAYFQRRAGSTLATPVMRRKERAWLSS